MTERLFWYPAALHRNLFIQPLDTHVYCTRAFEPFPTSFSLIVVVSEEIIAFRAEISP